MNKPTLDWPNCGETKRQQRSKTWVEWLEKQRNPMAFTTQNDGIVHRADGVRPRFEAPGGPGLDLRG
jgi:hypothetical protein